MKDEIKTRLAQIRAGKIPQGYKKTKLSIIPQEWEVMSLKSRFDRLTRKNSEGNTNVMTISAQYGLINQEEFFKKEIASEDKSNYYLLHNGEFAYNKSYSSGYPFGAIKRLSLYDKGIVSPLYICFSANNNNSCPEFYQHYFEGGKLNSEIQAIAQEGARNHGLLNISVEDFFYTKIIVPPLEEQKKIADILSAQDRIIELCERKTEQLKRMKKYYLQKMFPKDGEEYPEIRFKGFTDPWEQRKFSELTEIRSASRVHKEEWQTSGVPFYRSSDVMSALNGTENEKAFISKELYEKLSAVSGKLEKGDVLVTGGGSVGKPYIVPNNDPLYTKDADLLWIKNNKNIVPYFIYTFFFSRTFADYLNSVSHVGTIAHYTITQLGDTPITLPCVLEQQKIGDYFRNLDHLITLHQRKCEEEKKKKKALQQLLLTGIIRV